MCSCAHNKCDKTPAVVQSENSLLLKDKTELEEPELILVSGAPTMCSTPLRLDVIEDQNDIDERFDVKNFGISMFQEEETALFNGATTSVESFVDDFHSISDKHKFSKAARQELLKLIAKVYLFPIICLRSCQLLFCQQFLLQTSTLLSSVLLI